MPKVKYSNNKSSWMWKNKGDTNSIFVTNYQLKQNWLAILTMTFELYFNYWGPGPHRFRPNKQHPLTSELIKTNWINFMQYIRTNDNILYALFQTFHYYLFIFVNCILVVWNICSILRAMFQCLLNILFTKCSSNVTGWSFIDEKSII